MGSCLDSLNVQDILCPITDQRTNVCTLISVSIHAVHQDLGHHEEAIKHFSYVLKHQPNNSHALLRRGIAFKCLKFYDEASDDMERAKEIDGKDPSMYIDYRLVGKLE